MRLRTRPGGLRRTPRPASSIQVWTAPVRNADWLAALVGAYLGVLYLAATIDWLKT